MTRLPRPLLWFFLLLAITFPLAALPSFHAGIPPPTPAPPRAAEYEPGEVVVRWTDEVRPETLQGLEAELIEDIPSLGTSLVAVPVGREVEVAHVLAGREGVAWAEPNFIRRIAMIPNDPLYDRQWGLRKIDAPGAWETTLGSASIVVAVIDTGVDLTHPDLQGRLVPGRNVLDPEQPPQDDGGHGTHVSGTIAATINNGMGVAGVAPGVSIMPIKALKANGSGKDTDVAIGVRWAVDNGAHIINMSFGGTEVSRSLTEAVAYAGRKGVITVVAAGNEGSETPSYPAATEPNIAVAATDTNDRRGGYSNFGSWIVVSAPGSGIWSTWWGGQSSYRIDNGTSMAAPHVSGVIALMLSMRPSLTVSEITGILRSTADPVQDPGSGAGRVNAARAVAVLREQDATPTASPAVSPTAGTVRTPTPTLTPTRGVTRSSARAAFAMTYDVPSAGTTLYLPMLLKDVDGWSTEITIQSASETRGTVDVQLVREDGGVERVVRAALGGFGSLVVPLDSVDLPAGPWRGAAIVSADVRISSVVSMSAPTFDSMAYDARVETGGTVYAPLAFKNRNGWNSTVVVQNVGSRPATVRLTYRSSTDGGQWTETVIVPALASRSVALGERPIVPDGFAGSVLITSLAGEPLAAVAAGIHTSGSATVYAGAATGSTSLVAPMLFKNRATDGVWNTGIQLQNIGSDVARVTATYASSEDPSLQWTETVSIAAGAAETLYQGTNLILPDGFVGSAQITVSNGIPITGIVNEVNYEREISSVYELLTGGETQRFVPRLLRAADGRNSGLQVQNLGDLPAEISISYRSANGTQVARQDDVIGPRGSRTYYQPAITGLPDGFVGGAVIVSGNGQALAAVVNEVRY